VNVAVTVVFVVSIRQFEASSVAPDQPANFHPADGVATKHAFAPLT